MAREMAEQVPPDVTGDRDERAVGGIAADAPGQIVRGHQSAQKRERGPDLVTRRVAPRGDDVDQVLHAVLC